MGGRNGKIAASEIISREEEEVVERKEKKTEKGSLIGSEYLNWQAQFLFRDPELIT